jgi:hypothetical protein
VSSVVDRFGVLSPNFVAGCEDYSSSSSFSFSSSLAFGYEDDLVAASAARGPSVSIRG